jgi:ribosomal protein S27AE
MDVQARDDTIDALNRALRLAGACGECGGAFIADNQQGQACCGRCGALWEG